MRSHQAQTRDRMKLRGIEEHHHLKFFPGFFRLLFLTLLFICFSRKCSLNSPDLGQGSAQTRCWSQLREKVVEYWWLAVAGAILAYPVLHRANMYWSYRWYHKTKQEKLTWSWLSNVFNLYRGPAGLLNRCLNPIWRMLTGPQWIDYWCNYKQNHWLLVSLANMKQNSPQSMKWQSGCSMLTHHL